MPGAELTDPFLESDDAPAQKHPARILIADPRPIVTSGLAAACAETADLVAHAACHDVAQLPGVLGLPGSIDAVVVDAAMFDGDAGRAVEAIRRLIPDAAVLVLTTVVDGRLLEALTHEGVSCAAAYGTARQIVAALRALLDGQALVPGEVQRALMTLLRRPISPPSAVLTPREGQVLELAATGLTIHEIAARLHVSHSTAKTHLMRVYAKLDAPNRSAAVATALARGMLRPSPVPASA